MYPFGSLISPRNEKGSAAASPRQQRKKNKSVLGCGWWHLPSPYRIPTIAGLNIGPGDGVWHPPSPCRTPLTDDRLRGKNRSSGVVGCGIFHHRSATPSRTTVTIRSRGRGMVSSTTFTATPSPMTATCPHASGFPLSSWRPSASTKTGRTPLSDWRRCPPPRPC